MQPSASDPRQHEALSRNVRQRPWSRWIEPGAVMALGAGLGTYAMFLPHIGNWYSWPGLTMAFMGGSIFLLGGVLLKKAVSLRGDPGAPSQTGGRRIQTGTAWSLAVLAIYAALVGRIPYEPLTAAFLLVFWLHELRTRWWLAAISAVLVPVVLSVLLRFVLEVIPPGGSWLR